MPLFGDCAPGYGDAAIVGVIRRLNLCVEPDAGDATVLWHVGFFLGLLYIASSVRAGVVTMEGTLNIAQRTKKVDVDNRLPLKYYYRTADNLLKQARIFRDEGNTIDYYILLLRFSSLVSETIPEHRECRLYSREFVDYRKRLIDVVTELERLKPGVQKQVEQYNNSLLKPRGSSYSLPSSYSTPSHYDTPSHNTAFSYDIPSHKLPSHSESYDNRTRQPITGGSYNRNQTFSGVNQDTFGGNGTRAQVPVYGAPAPAYNPPGPSYNSTYLESQLKALSLNIPRPTEETLSRHSILGPSTQRPRREPAPLRVQYPSYVDATPIELPSFIQDWNVPAQFPAASTSVPTTNVSSTVAALESLSDPALWSGSQSSVTVDVAPTMTLLRQPSPPPIAASVQTVHAVHDVHDHSQTQLSSDLVADPRPGAAQDFNGDLSKGPKHLHISTKMMDEFMRLAKANTTRNLETCGVLAGSLKKGIFYVCTLIVPKQEATSDSCQTINEEEIFDSQDKRGLFQLGWIHTHPTQTCFMSSIDLHTHYSYQIMLPEAIAIVMAPTDNSRPYGIFRLSDPGGVKTIQQCQQRGFHPHEDPPDGSPIYECCSHVYMNPKLQFDVIDLRAQ
uniref:MPN domain-containing protein n=2 Tax=Physcomitrium patens TaxID=3218 RepID=A0A2K1KFW9_PHYPA|nr:hypothetical protein PHYPA_009051 [Physcomitrium patens]